MQRCRFLNSFKKDLAKLIWITFAVSEFLNIDIFNWYKTLYSAKFKLSLLVNAL